MSKKTRKAINFDFDTNKLKEFYSNNYNNAYGDIRRYLEKNGFEHRQGSGYVSKNGMSLAEINNVVENMSVKFQWLADCVNKMDVTIVDKQSYNILETIIAARNNDINKNQQYVDDLDQVFDIDEEEVTEEVER